MHLPLCYFHELDSVHGAMGIDTYTSNVMAAIARRAENGFKKSSIPAHRRERRAPALRTW